MKTVDPKKPRGQNRIVNPYGTVTLYVGQNRDTIDQAAEILREQGLSLSEAFRLWCLTVINDSNRAA